MLWLKRCLVRIESLQLRQKLNYNRKRGFMRKGLLAIIFFILLCFAIFQPKTEDVGATIKDEFIVSEYGI